MGQTVVPIVRRIFMIIGCLVPILIFPSCSADETQPDPSAGETVSEGKIKGPEKRFRSVSGAEAQTIINKNDDLIVIDVRTPQERNQVRIVGSQLVAIGDVLRGRLILDKDRPVLVICAVGGRSYIAGKALLAMGHQEVYNLDGGIEAWWRAGLPVETGPEKRRKD